MKRVIALLLCSMALAAMADDVRQDGNFWSGMNDSARLNFMVGFFSGIRLGTRLTVWGLPEKPGEPGGFSQERLAAFNAFSKMQSQYLNNVTIGQLRDGLDEFYRDYRNRSIEIPNAVWLILNEIKGTPRKQLEEMIEGFRRNAVN
jgi:hypothetical protein